MKMGRILSIFVLLLALPLVIHTALAAINEIWVTVIDPSGQPIEGMTLYVVPSFQDTTRAIAEGVTDSSGRTVITLEPETDMEVWVVGKNPVVYDVEYLSKYVDQSINVPFYLNRKNWFYEILVQVFLDDRLGHVDGNITIWGYYAGFVKIVDVPLPNYMYFWLYSDDNRAILEVPKTVIMGETEYRFVNITVHFWDGSKEVYNTPSYTIDPYFFVRRIDVFYTSAPAEPSEPPEPSEPIEEGPSGLPLTAWIAIGILLATAGGFVAVARSRKAMAAIMRERRVLRSTKPESDFL